MVCKPKKPKSQQPCGYNRKAIRVVNEVAIDTTKLKEKGRTQYFYHSQSSELPIRDVLVSYQLSF